MKNEQVEETIYNPYNENNKENKPHLSPITKLGILIFEPDINQKMKNNCNNTVRLINDKVLAERLIKEI